MPSPGDLPDPRIELVSLALQVDSLPAEIPGKPLIMHNSFISAVFHFSYLLFSNMPAKLEKSAVVTASQVAFQVTLVIKNPPANAGDIRVTGLIPESERYPWEGNGKPLQCSSLENLINRGTWWATVHGVAMVGHNWSDLTRTRAVVTGLKKVSFHSNPKEGQCQRMFKVLFSCTHFTC